MSASKYPQQTVSELAAFLTLHPQVSVFVVEGESDGRVVRWFLSTLSSRRAPAVYTQLAIAVPRSELTKLGLGAGARSRVIATAHLWHAANPQHKPRVLCVADADDAFVTAPPPASPMLALTDFTSMELYWFEEPTLRKLLTILGSTSTESAALFMALLKTVLQPLFLIHVANQRLGLSLDWVDPIPSLSYAARVLKFDQSDFLDRLLNKNSRAAERRTLERELQRLQTVASQRRLQAPCCMHGHHFLAILAWLMRQPGLRLGTEPSHEELSWTLPLSADLAGINRKPLFKRIARVAAGRG